MSYYDSGHLKLQSIIDALGLSNDASITSLPNAIGGGNTGTQATSGNRALFKTGLAGGKGGAFFDGVNDNYSFGNILSSLTTGTIQILVKNFADPPAGVQCLWSTPSAQTASPHPYTDGNLYEGQGSDARENLGAQGSGFLSSTYRLITITTAANDWKVYIDAMDDGDDVFHKTSNTVTFPSDFIVGVDKDLTFFFKGWILAIFAYDSVLNQTQRNQNKDQFANDYQLTNLGYIPTDTTPPTVSITAPSDGDTINGNVSVVISCSDDTGVTSLQLQVDGVDEGAPYTGSGITSHTFTWDSTAVDDGDHDINVVAEDAASNSTTSSPITVTVHNTNKIPVICGIDSLSIDIDTVAYPTFLQKILDEKYPNQYEVFNDAAVGGSGFFAGSLYDDRKADTVYAHINPDADKSIFILLGGINDIFAGTSASALYTKMAAEVAEAQGEGLEVWVSKLMPQAYALHYPGSITVVNAFNAMLDATPIGDKIIDFGAIPAASDPNNAKYYRPDLLHPTNDLNRAMAEYAASLFNPGIDFDLDTSVSIFDTAIPANNSDGYKFLDWKVNEVVKASQILPAVDYPDLSIYCKKDFSNKIELVGTNLVGDTASQIKHLAYTQDTLDKGVGEVPFNQIAKPGQRYLITVNDFDNADPPNVSSNSNIVDITVPAAPPFSPSDLSIVKCFIDPNQIEASNNDLIVPQDLSGHSNHFTQSTSGFKPKFKTNICNGKPMLLFDGVDDFLNFPNLSSFTSARIYVLLIRQNMDTEQLWDFGATTPAYPQGSEQNIYENFGLSSGRYSFYRVFSLLYPHIYSVATGGGTSEAYINRYKIGNTSGVTFAISSGSIIGNGAANIFCHFYLGPLVICNSKPSADDDIRLTNWLRDWGNLAF